MEALHRDPEFGYPLTALLAHSTVTGGPSLIDQLGDPLANLTLADTWRMYRRSSR